MFTFLLPVLLDSIPCVIPSGYCNFALYLNRFLPLYPNKMIDKRMKTYYLGIPIDFNTILHLITAF